MIAGLSKTLIFYVLPPVGPMITSLCPPLPGCCVLGERSARGFELLLLAGAEGLHQGHQYQASFPENQHAPGTLDGKGAP